MILRFFLLGILHVPISVYSATLEDAYQSALKKNELVGQAQERVVQANENLSKVMSGPQPNLSLNASYKVQPELSDPVYRPFSPTEQSLASLTLTQPLFRGFREFAALRRQRDLVTAERANQMLTLGDVFQSVATTYYEVLANEQDLRNLEDQRRLFAERAKNLVTRARRGESARNEPLAAQSSEAAAEADIQVAKTKLKGARENFKVATGLPAESELSDLKPEDNGVTEVEKLEYYMSRVEERPEIRAAKARVEAADQQVSIAKGSYWPTIDAVGNYYLKGPEGMQKDIKWDFQLKLSFPIYEGGLRLAETREASSKVRETQLELHNLRRVAQAQIASLYESAAVRLKHLEALKRAKELSQQNSQALERDYRRGLARNIDVQSALVEFGNIRRTYDQARYAARLDVIRLDRAANILPRIFQELANSTQE